MLISAKMELKEGQTHLIHHHHLCLVHFCHTLLDKVEYPARCGNHYMHY